MNKKSIKILSYNIHKGFSVGNRKFILAQIKEAIKIVKADVVFLQEVIGSNDKHPQKYTNWISAPQFEFLADSIWTHHAYGKNSIYSQGHHGNAILSNYPIVKWRNFDASTSPIEKRGFLYGVLEIPGVDKPLHIFCVHLSLLEKDRDTQINKLETLINHHVPSDEPLIIAGDFNDWRQRASNLLFHKLNLKESFFSLYNDHPKTFPSWMPVLKLDRIYYRNIDPVSALCLTGQPWEKLSDHVALLSEFKI